jgi:hypothetical protein
MSTADAVAREAAWLSTVSGDSLPFLPASAGGAFEVIAPYWQGAQTRTQAPAIYVLRAQVAALRVANQRVRNRYRMTLDVHWPIRATGPGASSIAAVEQQNLDDAVDLLRQRIAGTLGDKSHGGRFQAAGEAKTLPGMTVDFPQAETTIRAAKEIRASVVYYCDDFEISN